MFRKIFIALALVVCGLCSSSANASGAQISCFDGRPPQVKIFFEAIYYGDSSKIEAAVNKWLTISPVLVEGIQQSSSGNTITITIFYCSKKL